MEENQDAAGGGADMEAREKVITRCEAFLRLLRQRSPVNTVRLLTCGHKWSFEQMLYVCPSMSSSKVIRLIAYAFSSLFVARKLKASVLPWPEDQAILYASPSIVKRVQFDSAQSKKCLV